jgi:serine/threonine-protein kinase
MSSDSPTVGPRRTARIGKYEVLTHIATGGMGAVYRARDSETGADIALKVLTPEMANKPAMLERFRREARNAAKLRHINIVTVYDFGEADGTWYMAMEFVEGTDLHDYIEQKGKLEPEESRQIMIQAARALVHAHNNDIIHRDIKPSNFLLTTRNGRVIVKLTDLGLSRELTNDEFRVTRSGTTVGTVDYISPEQARDSGAADIRSDLYSLGCSWFHMLTGRPPFPEGGLAERLVKHMSSEPPDVRTFNKQVSGELVEVLEKLLAKKPSQRYQTPQELLTALLEMRSTAPKGGASAGKETPSDLKAGPARSPSAKKTDKRGSSPRKKASGRRSKKIALIVSGIVVLLFLGAAVAYWLRPRRKPEPEPVAVKPQEQKPQETPPEQPKPKPPEKVVASFWGSPDPSRRVAVTPLQLRPLPGAKTSFDAEQLRKEAEAPWAAPAAKEGRVLRVARLAEKTGDGTFPSLAAAVEAAPKDEVTAIEIHDNGPLFESGFSVADRSVIIRAGAGYRPLLVWDVPRTLEERKIEEGPAFLEVSSGSLTVEGCEIVTRWPEGAGDNRAAFFRVRDGDLTMRSCSVSLSGGPAQHTAAAQLTTTRSQPQRCRFERCYLRGARLLALDLDAPAADVLFDRTLLVAGAVPALDVRAGDDAQHPVTVRAVRSTLVTGRTLLSVRKPAAGTSPAVSFVGLDAVLSRSGPEGGALIELAPGTDSERMGWRAYNCVYAGWKPLVSGETGLRTLAEWHSRWKYADGDLLIGENWPNLPFHEPQTQTAASFRLTDHPLDEGAPYAGTIDPSKPLGADIAALPPTHDRWPALAFDRLSASPPLPLEDTTPDIPSVNDGRYHGERIDLTKQDVFDLGDHLKGKQLGPRVVLVFSGAGKSVVLRPIKLKDTTLVLCFKAPEAEPGKPEPPPTLLRYAPGGGLTEAWIDIEDGNLDVIGGDLYLPAFDTGDPSPAFLIKVKGGDVRLTRTRLRGPDRKVTGFTGLVCVEGTNSFLPNSVRRLAISDSVLLSRVDGVHLRGLGVQALLRGSVVATGRDGVHLDLGPHYDGLANVHLTLDRCTLAPGSAVLRVQEPSSQEAPAEAIVVQTTECVIAAPFEASKAGLLLGQKTAAQRGLVLWQFRGDWLDARLAFMARSTEEAEDKPLPPEAWKRVWGPSAGREIKSLTFTNPKPLKTADRWAVKDLAILQLPATLAAERRPGADLVKLRIVEKR